MNYMKIYFELIVQIYIKIEVEVVFEQIKNR